ncbi:MAG: peptidase M16 [Deltaproteobacteria bacterium SG8_13]|nr:MAG: peptidase M16 [Deltaproteobacteria bacterium SG8_13]
MKIGQDPYNPGIQLHSSCHGYQVTRIAELPENAALFYELQDPTTGARHVHISCEDRENTFGVALKTVPKDSTGVAHILEHTVLCGSEKFPVRDPFFSMLKRSLSTFMNAFTASDWTMYPFATQNRADFYNLMDVYLDAVFFPKLKELSFKQEGHRLELEGGGQDPASQHLVYKGVVYNEMKGAMSSADQVMGRSLLRALYPSTTYQHNSGGDPAVIPRLSFEQLRAFHRQHYHPSNAYFYTYGNLPLNDHLAFIREKTLRRFQRIDPDTEVKSQPRWDRPQQVEFSYPLAPGEDPSDKCQAAVGWLMADVRNTFEVLVIALIEQILLGNAGSPLRKALIDSRLGAALCDSAGLDADNRDTMFVCGLKGVAENAAGEVESIIFAVLKDLSANGIDQELIESAIHQLEFHRREVTGHPYPHGIRQLLVIAGTWLHGGDPLSRLQLDEDLAKVRSALDDGAFFESYLQRYFIDNPHRVRFLLKPDQQMEARENTRIEKELKQLQSSLQASDLEAIRTDSEKLKKLQEEEEDVNRLPTLRRKDIPPEIEKIREPETGKQPGLYGYEQKTSGISYYAAAAGVGRIDPQLIGLVPFYCFALPKIGSTIHDYTRMARRIDLYTGGVGLAAQARTGFDSSGACIPYVTFNAKCLRRNLEPMFDIVGELLGQPDFENTDRLKSLLLEFRANLESVVVSNGHRFAISLASRNFSAARHLNETWTGIHQLQRIKQLTEAMDDDRLAAVAESLKSIHRTLFREPNLKTALIGERPALESASELVGSIYAGLAAQSTGVENGAGFHPPAIDFAATVPREAWSTATAVSFVAQVFETVRMEHEDAPSLAIISKILRSRFLHREIREKGGAYGGFALYNPEDGLFCLASYRDPHIVATLQVFEKADEFITSGNFSEQDVNESLLQVCSEIDKPDPPGTAAKKAFHRQIISLSDSARQRFKQRLLTQTRKLVLDAAVRYFGGNREKPAVTVISSESQIAAANKKLDVPMEPHRI